MDTAKVDIRKLQLLNDRINQCIDALSQVRLSVHGLSHSSQQQPNIGFAGQGPGLPYGQQQGWGQQQFGQQGYGSPGFGQFGGFPQGGGFSHTSGGQPPFQQGTMQGSPWQQQGYGGQQAFGGQQGGFGQQPQFGQQPWSSPGLSHSNPEAEHYSRVPLTDPFMAMRIAQTFPYAQHPNLPYPPGY